MALDLGDFSGCALTSLETAAPKRQFRKASTPALPKISRSMKNAFAFLAFLLVFPASGEGLTWPKGQALPWFSKPAAALDAVDIRSLRADARLTISALQGQVNRKEPRIFLIDRRTEEGAETWPETATVDLGPREIRRASILIKKYAGEVAGVVLYDPSRSSHYRNLAGTVAGIRKALPMTREAHERLTNEDVQLEILEDLTDLTFTTALEIYSHLYDHYWPKCEKRIILSARPDTRGGDHHHTRDVAAAVGCAVVWLDGRIPEERDLLRRFFGDMKAGEAVVLGWYSTERSGITTASEFGIGTLPADFFMNASVYSGGNHEIAIPVVPKRPPLANKSYIALFISDGDNIQYNQHAMRRIWDRSKNDRRKTALNWTIAPGLVDIAPGILNYYYRTATPADCFVTGPSGMGYAMPVNTLREPGAPVGPYLTDPARMDGYASLTGTYLRRSGLRVMTIWDNATPMQRASYEKHCPTLYGATVQNFKDMPSVASSIENGRLRFEKLVIPYATTFNHLQSSLIQQLGRKKADTPQFLAYQINIWKELKPDRLNVLAAEIRERFPDQVEFVRADHYFNHFNEAHDLPFNLAMSAETSISPESARVLIDGTPATLWSSEGEETTEVTVTFARPAHLSRYRLDLGGSPDEEEIAISLNGTDWQALESTGRVAPGIYEVEFPPVEAAFLKIRATRPVFRLAEIEIYGYPSER